MSSLTPPRNLVYRGLSASDSSTWPGGRVDIKSGPGGFAFRWFRRSACSFQSAEKINDPGYERVRSARRAAGALRDRIQTGGLRNMFTFTHRANVVDLDVSRGCVTRFLRLVRVRYPKFKWAGAAERQKRGAWHWHLAVNGFYSVDVIRELWLRACGEALFGNVNVRAFDSSARAGLYLSKYLSKTFLEEEERPRYGHHYVVARGLRPDIKKYLLLGTSHDDLLRFVEEEARELGFTTRSFSSGSNVGFGRGWGDG